MAILECLRKNQDDGCEVKVIVRSTGNAEDKEKPLLKFLRRIGAAEVPRSPRGSREHPAVISTALEWGRTAEGVKGDAVIRRLICGATANLGHR